MKKILGVLAVALMMGACGNTTDSKEEKVEDSTEQTESTEVVEEVKADEESSAETETEVEESEPKEDDVPREHESALRKAESYLDTFAMSSEGVRDQLEYEKFNQDAIDYALENLEVDWNEQAKKSAENVTELFDMSDAKLYDQLIYKGFTEEQAQAGVDSLYE